MMVRITLFVLSLIGVAACSPVDAPGGEVEQTMPTTLTDRTLVLKYQSGLEVRGNYGATSVAWEALSGPARGSTGTEATHAVEVAPGIFFVSWMETSGTTVSQILDLNALRVTAFVTYAAESGRQSLFDVGAIEIQDP